MLNVSRGNDQERCVCCRFSKLRYESRYRIRKEPGAGRAFSDTFDSDIRILRDQKKPIDAVGAWGQNLSFDIHDGNSLNTVILKYRRLVMREAVGQ